MTGGELLNRKVVLRGGLEVGRVVDVILEPDAERVLGLDVRCGDGEDRFLPAAAADTVRDPIEVESPFTLLDSSELDFYRRHGRSLRRSTPAA